MLEKHVIERLEPLSKLNHPDVLEKDLEAWEVFYSKLKDKFEEKVFTIDANLCVENIIEKISFTLEQGL